MDDDYNCLLILKAAVAKRSNQSGNYPYVIDTSDVYVISVEKSRKYYSVIANTTVCDDVYYAVSYHWKSGAISLRSYQETYKQTIKRGDNYV